MRVIAASVGTVGVVELAGPLVGIAVLGLGGLLLSQFSYGGLGLGAQLDVRLPGIDRAVAQEIVEAAHQVCPYSKATRYNIEVKLSVVD